MDRSVGREPGGIRGLVELLREHGESVEIDLIRLGLRLDWLGTNRLSWRDLWVIVEQSPRTSAIARATIGPDVIWGLQEHLLASIVDELRWLHWAKTKDAGKAKNPPPERIPRPGVRSKAKKLRIGDAMTVDEFERRYAEKLKNAA